MVDIMRLLATQPEPSKPKRVQWVPAADLTAGPDPWLIRCWRVWAGLTIRDLSRICGIGPKDTSISKIEHYRWPVTDERLAQLSAGIGVDAAKLCSKTDEEAKAHAELYRQWVEGGKANLRKWLREWMVSHEGYSVGSDKLQGNRKGSGRPGRRERSGRLKR